MIFYRTLLCLILTLVISQSVYAQGIHWQELTIDEALQQASENDTLVLVDFYATWCGPCQMLDTEVFPRDEVGAATADLVAIKIDGETEEGAQAKARFHVVGYPTVLLLQPDGSEIDRVFGFVPAEEFVNLIEGYRQGRGTIQELRDAVAENPEDLEQVLSLALRSTVRGEYSEAQIHFQRIIEEDPTNLLGLRAQAHLIRGKYQYLRGSSDLVRAQEDMEIILSQFASADEARAARYQLAIIQIRAGQEEAALELFTQIISGADEGNESSAYNTVAWISLQENFRLGEAVQLAQQGLQINPSDHSLWDTLAELHYAQGQQNLALNAISEAIRLAPDQPYYSRQQLRFSQ